MWSFIWYSQGQYEVFNEANEENRVNIRNVNTRVNHE